MRDLFFLALLPLMLYVMVQRPFIAVGMSAWTAMFFPNAWLWGIASTLRYNLLFMGAAVIGYVALSNKPRVQFGTLGTLVLLFFAWTTLSTSMTSGLPELSWEIWSRFAKVILLFVFVVLVLDKQLHIDFFLWCIVLSIGFYGALEALKFLVTGGGHMISGLPGHVLGDRNELSLAFVMTLPVCAYLLGQYGPRSPLVHYGLLGLIGLLVAAVIGTQSRGGFVALTGLAAYFFFKSERKLLLLMLALGLAALLAGVVPESWSARMHTLNQANADPSFLGRLVAWKLSFMLAMQHPWFGGGFKALEYFPVWESLSQDFAMYPMFYTGEAVPDDKVAHAAHSIYFQVLGEHGVVGLLLYLAILVRSFLGARRVAKRVAGEKAAAWTAPLATMLQLAIFAFCLGGAALNFAYFELLFAMCAMVIVLETRIVKAALPGAAALLAVPLNAARSQTADSSRNLA